MIERNVDLASRDAARSAPDGLTLSYLQRPEKTRAEPPFCTATFACGNVVSAAPNKLICAAEDSQRCVPGCRVARIASGAVRPVEAVEPHKGHEISVVFSLPSAGIVPYTLNQAPVPGRVKGRCAGRQGSRSAA